MAYASHLYPLTLIAVATVLMWVPYVLARIVVGGPMSAFENPSPAHRPLPPWAQRAKQAHANTVENLVVFAPVVIAAALLGVATPMVLTAAWVFVWARLAYYLIYLAGLPILRTLAFTVGCAATLVIGVAVLQRVM